MSRLYSDSAYEAIKAAQRGERQGMEACLEILEKPLLKLIQRYSKLQDSAGQYLDQQELYNEVVLNTIQNIHRFSPDGNLPDRSIRNQMARYYVDLAKPALRKLAFELTRSVDVPEWARSIYPKMMRAIRSLEQSKEAPEGLMSPNPYEVAKMTGIPLSRVKLFINKGIHQPFMHENRAISSEHNVPDHVAAEEQAPIESSLLSKETSALVREGWDALSPYQQQVLTLRFGFNCEPLTRKEIADALGLTDYQVRKEEADGLSAIRESITRREKEESVA